jgi:hypothetical protein
MHRRFLVRGLTASMVVSMLGACTSISGLDQFSTGDCQDCSAVGSDATTSDDVSRMDDAVGSPPVDDASDSSPWSMGYPDGPEYVYEASGDSPATEAGAGDAAPPRDASRPDAGPRDAVADVAPEAAACDSTSCHGCCTAGGLCAAGGGNSACGTGGATCQDCSSSGLVCTGGACASAPVDAGDAGSSGCDPTKCSNLCVPYFIQCCKTDQSCGCAVFYPRGSCN